MSAMILGLQNLPPISLEVEPVGDRFGEVPFAPVFRVHPSNGVILETRITLFKNGPEPGQSEKVGESGDFSPVTLNFVGIFLVHVTRIGITNTGITNLSKSFHVEGTPKPEPIVPPFISVKSNGDGSFTVSGSKFLPNATVTIRVVDAVQPLSPNLFFTVSATPEGEIKDFPTGKICQVPGGRIAFSAQDGRIDAGQAVTSNFVQQTCPFPK